MIVKFNEIKYANLDIEDLLTLKLLSLSIWIQSVKNSKVLKIPHQQMFQCQQGPDK